MDISVVVPVFNEAENISDLNQEINLALKNYDFEIVFVDDHSSDNTLENLKKIAKENSRIRIIHHKQNYGQSSAVYTGVNHSKSKWIATIDGDGQNDPSDIPLMYEELLKLNKNTNAYMIAGFRAKRMDSALKIFSSRYANKLRNLILKDGVLDTGCGLKLFSRNRFLDLPFFDHMHRYLPALHQMNGGKVRSIKVNHRPRTKGVSKYGFNNRFWVGITDMLGVRWLQKRSKIILVKEV